MWPAVRLSARVLFTDFVQCQSLFSGSLSLIQVRVALIPNSVGPHSYIVGNHFSGIIAPGVAPADKATGVLACSIAHETLDASACRIIYMHSQYFCKSRNAEYLRKLCDGPPHNLQKKLVLFF